MNTIEEKIAALHAEKTKVCLVCTGAGAGCQNLLSQVPGASGTILESSFPYSKEALTDFLGFEPEKFASEETALRMAAKAWRRATEIVARQGGDVRDAVGIGATAVIATNRALRGEHRIFIAARTERQFYVAHVGFAKNKDNLSVLGRIREGKLCDLLTLNMILYCAGVDQLLIPKKALYGEDICGRGPKVILRPQIVVQDPQTLSLDQSKHVLFEGSFNPLHFGHERIAKEVEALTGKKVVYVITNNHPDKGGIGEDELRKRLDQFEYLAPVLATDGLRLYVDKVKAYPGFSFIIGADTLRRILDPKYGVSAEGVLNTFKECRAHFFVANRPVEEGTVTLDALLRDVIPLQFHGMFTQIATMAKISSTTIRGPVL